MRYSLLVSILSGALALSSAILPAPADAQGMRDAHGMQDARAQVEVQGHAPVRAIVRRGGRRVPLRIALADIVPRAYSINLPNAGAWADAPVSWRGHGTFVAVIREMLAPYPDLVAHVDTDLQLVTVTRRPASFASLSVPPSMPPALAGAAPPGSDAGAIAAAAVPTAPPLVPATAPAVANSSASRLMAERPRVLAWSSSGPDGGASHEAGLPLAPAPVTPSLAVATVNVAGAGNAGNADNAAAAAPLTRTWQITPADKTVRSALARWAAEAGWQFVWDVPTDFSVDASATIHGTLEQALSEVVHALKRSQVPIQVILYGGNKVIRVVGEGAA
jgi:hypothetical protein